MYFHTVNTIVMSYCVATWCVTTTARFQELSGLACGHAVITKPQYDIRNSSFQKSIGSNEAIKLFQNSISEPFSEIRKTSFVLI